jgi:uncharacterized protein YkwD
VGDRGSEIPEQALLKIAAVMLFTVTAPSPLSNPPRSIPPSAAFVAACEGTSKPTPACTSAALENIDSARATEGIGHLKLPLSYSTMSFDRQLLFVTNAERSARKLGSLAENRSYDQLAQVGADNHTDPIGPPGKSWGSNWAGGVADPLAADFLWMYDDGPDSPNGDCPRAGAPGCWGHRDNILGPGWTSMGSGHYQASVTELFVR